MWQTSLDIAQTLPWKSVIDVLQSKFYGQVKAAAVLADRRRVKDDVKRLALSGWIPNVGDDDFCL